MFVKILVMLKLLIFYKMKTKNKNNQMPKIMAKYRKNLKEIIKIAP